MVIKLSYCHSNQSWLLHSMNTATVINQVSCMAQFGTGQGNRQNDGPPHNQIVGNPLLWDTFTHFQGLLSNWLWDTLRHFQALLSDWLWDTFTHFQGLLSDWLWDTFTHFQGLLCDWLWDTFTHFQGLLSDWLWDTFTHFQGLLCDWLWDTFTHFQGLAMGPESDSAPGKEGIACQVLMKRLAFFSNVCFVWSFPDLIIMPQFVICPVVFSFFTLFPSVHLYQLSSAVKKQQLCLFLSICFTDIFCFVIYFDWIVLLYCCYLYTLIIFFCVSWFIQRYHSSLRILYMRLWLKVVIQYKY